jgi:hypothetical protein
MLKKAMKIHKLSAKNFFEVNLEKKIQSSIRILVEFFFEYI